MEAVAAASSIAGLVSLVGQALDGIVKLRAFFKDCAIASKTVDRFLRDLNSLIQTLEEVKNIVARLDNVPASTFDNEAMISSLQYQLEDCSKDVYDWVRIASEQHSKFSNGSKAVFKRFMVAVNKESYADIFREIGSHRDGLMLKLSLIGRSLEIQHATSLQTLGGRLEDVTIATTSGHQVTAERLERLEAQLAVDREALSDIPDLRSLASSISDIVNILSSQPPSHASNPSSAHCSSAGGQGSQLNPSSRRGSAASIASNISSGGSRRHVQNNSLQGPSKPAGSFSQDWKYRTLVHSQYTPLDESQEKRDAVWTGKWEPEISRNNTIVNSEYKKESPPHPLLGSYEKFIDKTGASCPEPLINYINLVQYSRTIKLHAKLLVSIRCSQLDMTREQLQESDDYRDISEQLAILDHDVRLARKSCWKHGYGLDEIDMILEIGCIHELSYNSPKAKEEEEEVEDGQKDLAALQRLLKKLTVSRTWSAKQDHINQWLLQKLVASSDEVALHKSFFKSGEKLEERQWARQVLKFWPLDGAALRPSKGSASTNGAIDSLMGRHSVKVLLEMVEQSSILSDGDIGNFLNETEELLKHRWDAERPKSPLRENALFVSKNKTDH